MLIRKNDILVFSDAKDNEENSRRIMLAKEDADESSSTLYVRELNDWFSQERVVNRSDLRVKGKKREGESDEDIVKRYLSEGEWEYTAALYRQNHKMKRYQRRKKIQPKKETATSDNLLHPKRQIKPRGIILINEESGGHKVFESINGAAVFLGTNFANVQRAALYNGMIMGWRVYETPESINEHIKDLMKQLEILKECGIINQESK